MRENILSTPPPSSFGLGGALSELSGFYSARTGRNVQTWIDLNGRSESAKVANIADILNDPLI